MIICSSWTTTTRPSPTKSRPSSGWRDRTGADVLTCLKDMFDGDHSPGMHTVPRLRWLCNGANITMSLFFNAFGDANAMIRRTAFLGVGGYSEDYGIGHEDWELFARLVLKGYKLELVPEALFWHRTLPGSLTVSTPVRRNYLRSLRPHLEFIPEEYQPFFEMCIGQSLVNRGLLWDPDQAPAGAPVPATAPSAANEMTATEAWPLRYRVVDGLNARLKRFSLVHRTGKSAIDVLMRLRRRIRDLSSVRSAANSQPKSAADLDTGARPLGHRGGWWSRMFDGLKWPANRHVVSVPTLDDEIGEYKRYLKGKVLNAGAGCRDISGIVDGELVNQDIPHGLHNANIHIYSPIHSIPVDDDHFDSVFCNAVLEHVANPVEVVEEMFRVLKPGGYLYLCIPFMQPEHLDPTDFQRYTKDGLKKLVTDQGFEVEKIEGVHSVYMTLAWIVELWLRSNDTLSYRMLRDLVPDLPLQVAHVEGLRRQPGLGLSGPGAKPSARPSPGPPDAKPRRGVWRA